MKPRTISFRLGRICLACVALLGGGIASGNAAGENQPAAPAVLTCEFLRDPDVAAIYDPAPEFGWQCGTGDDAYSQTAFRLIVQTAADGDDNAETLWDTGRIDGNQSINIPYDGPPLQSGRSYQWRVQAWDDAGNETPWSDAQTFHMAARLSASRTSRSPLQVLSQPAVEVRALSDRELFADFGKDAFGYVVLRLPAADQPRVFEVRFGERLDGDRIDQAPGGTIRYYAVTVTVPAGAKEIEVRPPRDFRNTTGAAVRLPRSIGVVAPFRYVEIIAEEPGLTLAAEHIVRRAVQYPFDRAAAEFESSDPVLNDIWQLCKYSIEATTFCGVYVDGDRERIPYEADAYINQLAHYGVDQEYALARYSHEYLLEHPTWPTEWKQHSVLMAWADYLYTGNRESLAAHYRTLQQDKTLVAAERPDGLLDTSSEPYQDIVDWPAGERDGHEMLPVNAVVNAFHYATLTRMAKIADALGHDDDAAEYREKAARFRTVFNEKLWNDAAGAYVDGLDSTHSSIHANLFPLAFGLVPAERVDATVAFVKSRGMACSVYAAQFLLEGLYRHDRGDVAFDLLTSTGKRSWVNMLRSGSTITLEAWDESFKPNLDWNHAWGAAPANIIPMYLVGVRPTEPGFAKFVVQPRPGELQWFTARVPSIRGPIEVSYRRDGAAVQLEAVVPGNCEAAIAVPVPAGDRLIALSIDGREVPPEVRGGHAWVEGVTPGRHEVSATFAPAISQAGVDSPAG
ncbi:MAG: alpha-L-rhamnosidase [Planctomycetaceae bacterium]|nr:alpha-L-rhamnosidase [Planctomycetaceae bacterium]